MKSIIKILILSVITTTSYSQDDTENIMNKKLIHKTNLPEVVIKSAEKDFSTYISDMNVDPRVAKLQDAFLSNDLAENLNGYDLIKNQEGYGTFQVLLELENGEGKLQATYNEKGKLESVVEKYENIQLPNSICHSIYKAYPGWQIVENKYNYSQEDGRKTKKEYKITMTKDNKTKKITVIPEGNMVAIR